MATISVGQIIYILGLESRKPGCADWVGALEFDTHGRTVRP